MTRISRFARNESAPTEAERVARAQDMAVGPNLDFKAWFTTVPGQSAPEPEPVAPPDPRPKRKAVKNTWGGL